jgi:hypothetical protein
VAEVAVDVVDVLALREGVLLVWDIDVRQGRQDQVLLLLLLH